MLTAEPPTFGVLATMPGREKMLEKVISQVLPQVDRLFVRLNGHHAVPPFLHQPGIEWDLGPNLGVAAKLRPVETLEGLVLSFDDDIHYPDDYAQRIRQGIRRWGDGCIVGFHSSLVVGSPPDWWTPSRRVRNLPFQSEAKKDLACNALGFGTIGWISPRVRLAHNDFPFPVGVDAQLAVMGQRRRIPFVSLSRPAGWMSSLWPKPAEPGDIPDAISIWRHTISNVESPLNASRAHAWALAQTDRWLVHLPQHADRAALGTGFPTPSVYRRLRARVRLRTRLRSMGFQGQSLANCHAQHRFRSC